MSRQNSIIGDTTKSILSTKNGIDDPVEEACGDGYEGDVENPLLDNLIATNDGASGNNNSSRSNGSSEDDRDRQQSSLLNVSPQRTFVNIHERTPDTDSRTGGENGSSVARSSHGGTTTNYPSDTSSGMYYDDTDNVVVAVEDTRMQQVTSQLETSCLGSREEDTTSSSNSSDNNKWPVDEEVIDVEAPPGWLGVVIGTFCVIQTWVCYICCSSCLSSFSLVISSLFYPRHFGSHGSTTCL